MYKITLMIESVEDTTDINGNTFTNLSQTTTIIAEKKSHLEVLVNAMSQLDIVDDMSVDCDRYHYL